MDTDERIQLRDELINNFMNLQIIRPYRNRFRIDSFNRFNNVIKVVDDLYQKFELYVSQFRSKEEALYCIRYKDDSSNHLCPICNNVNMFLNKFPQYKYQKTCGSKECRKAIMNSDITKQKRKQTSLKRYGNETYNNRTKCKQTCLDKYGVEYVSQSDIYREKYKQTCLERYGVEYVTQSKEVQDKMKQTNLERYGVENVFSSTEIKDKIKHIMLSKYGCNNPMKCNTIKEKVKRTCMLHKDVNNNYKNIDNIDIWLDDILFKKFVIDIYNSNGKLLTLYDICHFFNVKRNAAKRKIEKLDLLNYFYIQESNLEVMFREFLMKNNIEHDQHNRTILPGDTPKTHKEIDFLCENFNIGFEINDIGSHNIIGIGYYDPKDKYYHRDKTVAAKKYGIRLIHIWEWEMRNEDEWNRLSKWILNLLNNHKIKIGARKCTIKEVSCNEEKEFLNNYHLQGYKKSEVCLGLYHNNELLQLMSFSKPRYNKNYEWELLRLCAKYSYSIIGGAKKLLSNFIACNNPKSIISYCNLDKFTGNIYEKIGFKLEAIRKPDIIWCNKEMKHFTQASLNWIGADKLLGTNYGKGTDNVEIVLDHGYIPVYNCGLAVYTMKL